MFDELVEQKIQQALRQGEFDNLPGSGQPLAFEDDSDIPAEARMAYKILKNAGVLPEELQLRKDINGLKALLDETPPEHTDRRQQLLSQIDQNSARYYMALEKRRQL